MIDKKLLIGICLILCVALLVSGCGVSDYISGEAEKEQDYSLLTDDAGEKTNDSEDDAEDVELNETEEPETNETEEEIEEEPETEFEITEEGEIVVKVYENDTVELKPQVNDADEDSLTYTFTEPLNQDGVWETEFGDAGQYEVTVSVSDGELETSKTVVIMVQRLNVPPVIEPIDEIIVDEGDTIELEPSVEDPNGDEFEVTIGSPIGEDGIWEIDYRSAGDYTVVITAEDIDGEVGKIEVPITVNKKNVPPVIEIDGDEFIIEEGDTIELEMEITDPNGDDINITISDPIGNDRIWETGYTDHGDYTITITASDGESTSSKEISLIVNDINMPPEIIDIINIGGGFEPECIADSDCDDDEYCEEYECIEIEEEETTEEVDEDEEADEDEEIEEECFEDSDCEDDLVCVKNQCTEMKHGCEDDNDCEGDLICVDGFCEE